MSYRSLFKQLSVFILLFVVGVISLKGQNTASLETLLSLLPQANSPSEISNPTLAKAQLFEGFNIYDEVVLDKGLALIDPILNLSTPDTEAEQEKLLEGAGKQILNQIKVLGPQDSTAFAQLQNDITQKMQGSFDQKKTFVAIKASRYLLAYFYDNPFKADSKEWVTYRNGTNVAEAVIPDNSAEVETLKKKLSNLTMWNTILLILCLLSIAGLIFLYLTKANKSQIPSTGLQQKDIDNAIRPIQEDLNVMQTKLASLAEMVDALEPEEEEEEEIEEEAGEQKEEAAEEKVASIATTPPVPYKTFFSVAPKNGLFFTRQFSDSFTSREHIYRVEVVDENTAFYYLVDDEATRQHAFNIPDSYIIPAMEVDGTGRLADAKQITSQRGQLSKAGNNWKIEEKAVLHYEL